MFVICLLNARGDYLLNLPALRALAAVADSPTVLVVRSGAHWTFLRDVSVEHVVEVDVEYRDHAYHFDPESAACRILKMGKVDTFVSLNPWWSDSLETLVMSLRPRRSVGFGSGPWHELLPLDFTCHNVDLAFMAAQVFDADLKPDSFSWSPAYPPEAFRFARELRDELTGGPMMVVHRDTKPPKEWIDGRWLEFLHAWLVENQSGIVIDVSLKPLVIADADKCWSRVLHTLGLPLEHALAVTSTADMFVGVDSCFLHAADLARIPAVGLFFATEPHEFGLRWSTHRNLAAAIPEDLGAASVHEALAALIRIPTRNRVRGAATPNHTAAFRERHIRTRSSFRNRNDLYMSTVGLGTGRLALDRDLDAIEVLLSSLVSGCNVFDIAGNYGDGDAASLVGRGLSRAFAQSAATRSEIFLCGKAGFTEHLRGSPAARDRGWADLEHCMENDYLLWEFERQCRWLGVTCLDSFLIQNPEEGLVALGAEHFERQLRSAFELFEHLVSQRRLQLYGVSTAEALRVPQEDPRHLDLQELLDVARQAGGEGHKFRVVELPVSVLRLEALEVAAHTSKHGTTAEAVPALIWADKEKMIVLGSSPLNGGWQLQAVSAAVGDVIDSQDHISALLQVARSLPGVTTTLVGITSPEHVMSVRTVLGEEVLDLTDEKFM